MLGGFTSGGQFFVSVKKLTMVSVSCKQSYLILTEETFLFADPSRAVLDLVTLCIGLISYFTIDSFLEGLYLEDLHSP